MSLTFGPVSSRRFGLSLGIDLSPEQKQCNYDCLYCELKGAKTVDKVKNPPLVVDVIKDVTLSLLKYTDIEVITITANGEPTLYPNLKELVSQLNKIKKEKKLLILSNASTISSETIQDALLDIDIVKLSLDSADEKIFKKLDRPHKQINLQDVINGMIEFRKKFKNSLVLEVLVVKDLNDTKEEFEKLNLVFNKIKPDRVDIGTIDRPSAYKVDAVTVDRLEFLSKFIENIPVNIAKRDKNIKGVYDLNKDEILSLLKKRPQSEGDVKNIMSKKTQQNFFELLEEKKIKLVDVANINFYKIS
ncbi:MAG: radical SAM protein [Campylobacteraceae bacterium]|jgi:wyosine [tRNA(Phe)-imidazoG37] synthetase (radical SAM superfamily)|nr:radical SAM protein [Campylobacteraceae bacterium]